jgi:hypothetical protein
MLFIKELAYYKARMVQILGSIGHPYRIWMVWTMDGIELVCGFV